MAVISALLIPGVSAKPFARKPWASSRMSSQAPWANANPIPGVNPWYDPLVCGSPQGKWYFQRLNVSDMDEALDGYEPRMGRPTKRGVPFGEPWNLETNPPKVHPQRKHPQGLFVERPYNGGEEMGCMTAAKCTGHLASEHKIPLNTKTHPLGPILWMDTFMHELGWMKPHAG